MDDDKQTSVAELDAWRRRAALERLRDTLPRLFDLGWRHVEVLSESIRVNLECADRCAVIFRRFDLDARWNVIAWRCEQHRQWDRSRRRES